MGIKIRYWQTKPDENGDVIKSPAKAGLGYKIICREIYRDPSPAKAGSG